MNRILFSALLVSVAATGLAQTPSATFNKSIAIGGVGTSPTGVVGVNGDVYANAFGNQRLVKVSNILDTTPTVTQHADLSVAGTGITWAALRGPGALKYNPSTNLLYSFGDTGTAGAIIATNLSGTIVNAVTIANRISSGDFWNASNDVILGQPLSSSLVQFSNPSATTPTLVATSPTFVSPLNTSMRNVSVVGGKIYYNRSGTTNNALAVYTPSGANLATTDSLSVAVYTTTGVQSVAYNGQSVWNTGSKTYLIYTDQVGATIKFINTATDAVEYTLEDTVNFNSGIRGVSAFQISGDWYLAVAATSPSSSILIYNLSTGSFAAGVKDWSLYN